MEFNDRRQFRSRVSERGERAHGTGDVDKLFPDGAPRTSIPLPEFNRRKGYDKAAVKSVLQSPPTEDQFVDVDPRTLTVSQGSVTREGVKHYLSGEYERTGTTFADQGNVGNRHPVVYERSDGSERIALSGHHRAMAALIQGKPLRMRRVQGP